MWSNRMLVLGAAAVGAAAMMVGPAAAPASAEPCAPMVAPTPGCTPPDVPPPNGTGAGEAAIDPNAPLYDPIVPPAGQPAGVMCPTGVVSPLCAVPPEAQPDADMGQAPPPNPCDDIGYALKNNAECMTPPVGEAQAAG
jgi:hypothetical protein